MKMKKKNIMKNQKQYKRINNYINKKEIKIIPKNENLKFT